MSTPYPEYSPDGQEKLLYPNAWRGEQEQTVEGADCFAPFVSLNPTENLIVLNLTEQEYLEMFSALYAGAEFTYPEKYLQIIANFLKGIHCPPELEEQECYDYSTYASFMRYTPTNPYITPDEVPEGYETQPFIVNGENGNDIPNYEHFDVIVPNAAITLDIDWWTTIAGQLPTIEIMVQGEGKAFIKMLTLPNGGLAVITVDNPPDLLDIIAGIVTAGENIIDLNQDLVSLPPETAQELIFPLDIAGSGLHTIYIVFLPILDDSFIPIRFGGGFRGVQLCDFVEQPEMGITNLRVEDCNLEQQIDGEWTVVEGWEDFLAFCLPSGGGGGVAAFKTTTYDIELGANQDTTSTSMVQAAATVQSHQYTYSNALIFAECQLLNTNAGANAFFQVRNNGALSAAGGIQRVGGNVGEVLYVSAGFTGLDKVNPSNISIYFRASANTARIGTGSRVLYTILEYEDASDLESMFVQDIDYAGGILRKKIDGSWFNVVDIAALLAPIQTTANNAAAAAAAAQTTANSAVTVNNSQNSAITILDSRLDSIETLDLPQINLTLADHSSRIAALEAAVGANEVWSREYDFQTSNHGWAATSATYVAGQGFQSINGIDFQITKTGTAVFDQRITHIKLEISAVSGVGVTQDVKAVAMDLSNEQGNIRISNAGITTNWLKCDTAFNGFVPSIFIQGSTGQYYLRKITILGRGINVYFP